MMMMMATARDAQDGSASSQPGSRHHVLLSADDVTTRMSEGSVVGSAAASRRRKLIANEYEKRAEIGRGTYGTVYDGVHVTTQRRVAIKKVSGRASVGEAEATLLRACQGAEYVVQMMEVVRENGKVYLILEFMDSDLENVIKATDKLPQLEIAHIKGYLQMLLRGVAELHSRHILHRDLKPNNLLIRTDGRIAKIADFGMATQLSPDDTARTKSVQVVTRAYRAPELIFGDTNYSYAVDVWSVGCIFAEMLLRKPFFDGSSDIEQLSLVFAALGSPAENKWDDAEALPFHLKFKPTNPKPLADQFPELSSNGVDLLSRLLQLDPKKRISVDDALQHAFFTEAPEPATGSELPIVLPEEPKKRSLAELLAGSADGDADADQGGGGMAIKGRRLM